MKDFYDIWMLSSGFDFKGEMLARAVESTFRNRHTPVPLDPAIFDPHFRENRDKRAQWQGFVVRSGLTKAPGAFPEVVDAVKLFLEPPVIALLNRCTFDKFWNAPGPWN